MTIEDQYTSGQNLETAVTSKQDPLKVQIRWLIRRDMPEVLDIEKKNFEYVWTEEDFLCCLRQRNCIGMVAEAEHKINGFMIYELHKMKLRIVNFAVDPDYQRKGIGSQMTNRMIEKLSQQRRKEIVLEVRESNLPAHLFFKEQGFRAIRVLRDHYEDTTEDAYVMQYRLIPDGFSEGNLPFSPKNRITEYDAA